MKLVAVRKFRWWLAAFAMASAVSSQAGEAQPAIAGNSTRSTPNGFASEGDSISVSWGGNYTGIYSSSRPKVRHCALAAGGGIDAIAARANKVFDCNPE